MSIVGQADKLTGAPMHAQSISLVAWASLVSACAAWMFDAMDLQIFTLVLFPSVSELVGSTNPPVVAYTGGLIFAWKFVAVGLGGIVFGVAADRIGRSATMIMTVIIYSVFTGLSAFAQNWWQLALLQALAGVGIGGEWAAGAALIAETWPERIRPRALIIMQLSFAVGVFLAALLNLVIGPVGWRFVFAAGAAPALLTIGIRIFVPEPERWIKVKNDRRLAGLSDTAASTFLALFAPDIRRRVVVGFLIVASMMIGSFAAGAMLPVWVPGLVGPDKATFAVTLTSQFFMLTNVGAVLGYLTMMWLTGVIGRRWSYFVTALGSATSNLFMFTQIHTGEGLLWFAPVWGFFSIGGFGTFAIYLPELFPTRMRATGQGFCWNAARIFTAVGPLTTGAIVGLVGSAPAAGALATIFYLVGTIAIWFGPETCGKPLSD
jgi:predicted MFS family arabinose efflux permease